MNLDELKQQYHQAGTAVISKTALEKMTRVSGHPAVKQIRRQLIIETVAWTAFLLVYYDFFDGHLRSLYWNGLLVLAVLLLLVHNVLGYRIVLTPIMGDNLRQSLARYVATLKRYAIVSIASRALAFSCVMWFLISGLALTPGTYRVVAALALIVLVQVISLRYIWSGRIRQVRETVRGLDAP